jgi:hypothetical protein
VFGKVLLVVCGLHGCRCGTPSLAPRSDRRTCGRDVGSPGLALVQLDPLALVAVYVGRSLPASARPQSWDEIIVEDIDVFTA